jgi:hypothetical protein
MFAKRNEVGKAIPNTPVKKNKPTKGPGLLTSSVVINRVKMKPPFCFPVWP